MAKRPKTWQPPATAVTISKPRDKVESKKERDKFYRSAAWIRCRAAFLNENPLCQDCEIEGKLTEATIPHHVIDRLDREDLAFDWDNLEPCCSRHHTLKHTGGKARVKLTLALDFNGVIHDHVKAVEGKGPIMPGSPEVPGAIDFLKDAVKLFKVAILSARFARTGAEGIKAMIEGRAWLITHGIPAEWITMEPNRNGRVFLSGSKLPYLVCIDDRSIRFTGTFPTPSELLSYRPWNVQQTGQERQQKVIDENDGLGEWRHKV